MMSTRNRLYLLLELEKFKQEHPKMPTIFIFPVGNLVFSGIMYYKDSPDYSLRFVLEKQSIDDAWEVKICNSNEILNFGQKSMSETLLQLNTYNFIQNQALPVSIFKMNKSNEEQKDIIS